MVEVGDWRLVEVGDWRLVEVGYWRLGCGRRLEAAAERRCNRVMTALRAEEVEGRSDELMTTLRAEELEGRSDELTITRVMVISNLSEKATV